MVIKWRSLAYTLAILMTILVISGLQGFYTVSRADGTIPPTATLNTGNVSLLERKEALTFAEPWRRQSAALGAFFLGVAKTTGFTDYVIPTRDAFRFSCDFIRVYRVTPFGDLILHPSECGNDVMSFESVGTGHYIFYVFNTKFAAQHAPQDILFLPKR
jgi:hypothetical protein